METAWEKALKTEPIKKVEIQVSVSSGIKVFENTETYKGERAVCWQFHLNEFEETQKLIKALGTNYAYQKIETEKSRKDALEHAKWLIENGNYKWYSDPENGTLWEDLPEEDRGWIGRNGSARKWSKWTPELILKQSGWEEDEVYWFSISKNDIYTYQLILREGDWIAFCPVFINHYDGRLFINVQKDIDLPFKSEWKEITR